MNSTQPDIRSIIAAHADAVALNAVQRQYQRQPGDWNQRDSVIHQKSLRDVRYHLDYLGEAAAVGEPQLFQDYVAWAKVLYSSLGFKPDMLPTTLHCIRQALEETLPAEALPPMLPIIDQALASIDAAPVDAPGFLDEHAPMSDLARAYLDALLRADRQEASRLILEAVQGGSSIKEIYLNVFQRCQHEIGRLWQSNQISVAQEHYCTAATQLIMSQLYPYLFNTERRGRRLVATCVGGELHEIGMRMVADFFEMDGWDTYYLGANMPATSIVKAVQERQADVLGISATITSHVADVTELIRVARASGVGDKVKILVGGYPFNISPDLWQKVGADGFGRNALDAVETANSLLSTN